MRAQSGVCRARKGHVAGGRNAWEQDPARESSSRRRRRCPTLPTFAWSRIGIAQQGQDQGAGFGLRGGVGGWSYSRRGIPERNWMRSRFFLAAGWQNPE